MNGKRKGREGAFRHLRCECVLLCESIIPATHQNTQPAFMPGSPTLSSKLLFHITSSTTLASPSSVPPKLAARAAFLLSFASA